MVVCSINIIYIFIILNVHYFCTKSTLFYNIYKIMYFQYLNNVP